MCRRRTPPRPRKHRGGDVLSPAARRLPIAVAIVAIGAIAAVVLVAPKTERASGIVVAVDSASLTAVTSFTLRTGDGTLLEFGLKDLENPVAFPPGHLFEHVATGAPVIVTYRREDGVRQAVRLEDAPLPSPT